MKNKKRKNRENSQTVKPAAEETTGEEAANTESSKDDPEDKSEETPDDNTNDNTNDTIEDITENNTEERSSESSETETEDDPDKTLKKNSEEKDGKSKASDPSPRIGKKKIDRTALVMLLGEIVILAICAAMIFSIKSGAKPAKISMDEWFSDYITYSEEGWKATPQTVNSNDEVDLIYGPYLKMSRGTYLVTVDYSTTEDQVCYAASSGGQENFLQTGNSRLSKDFNTVSFRAYLKHEIDNFEVIVRYNGRGNLTINNITICEDYSTFSRLFVYILAIFIICDIFYLFYDKIKKNRNLLLSLLGIALLCSLPLFTDGIGKGHDLNYHAMRIEALADSIKHGVFPNRMSALWFNGYGYPSSIYYGDLLLYIPALLRVAGFGIVTSYKAYVLFINLGTSVISYLCFKGIVGDRRNAVLSSLVYSASTYRLVNLFIRSAVGEYTAMMFFPITAYAIYKIYTDNTEKNWKKNALCLAVSMFGMITCHILSTEMAAFILAAVCIVLFKKTFKPLVIKTYLLAVGESLLLSAYFLIPFADYYRNVTVRINDTVDYAPFIQHHGCMPSEYFAVFRDIFSNYTVHYNSRIASTPGLLLMFVMIIGIAFCFNGRKQRGFGTVVFLTAFSIFSLFLASNVFPWDAFAQDSSIGRLLAQVQFPWRYVAMAIIFLTLLFSYLFKIFCEKDFGSCSKYIKSGAALAVAAVCISCTFLFTGGFLDDIRYRTWYDTPDLDTGTVGSGEYKLPDAKDYLDNSVHSTAMKNVEIIERDGCKMVLSCEGIGISGTVEVPIFNYKGYTVTDDEGNKYEIFNGDGGTIKFDLPKNFKGNITVDFVSPWFWRLSEAITLISIVYLVIDNRKEMLQFFRKILS